MGASASPSARKDGTHAVWLDPLDFIARLCALVPPPRFHMLRYHGVFAAHSSARPEVVLGRKPQSPPQLPLFAPAHLAPPRHLPRDIRGPGSCAASSPSTSPPAPSRAAADCMRLVEIAQGPDDIARVLASEAPLRARDPRRRSVPAPRPGQLVLLFG